MALNIELSPDAQYDLVFHLNDIVITSEKADSILEGLLARHGNRGSIREPFTDVRKQLHSATIAAVALQLIDTGLVSS